MSVTEKLPSERTKGRIHVKCFDATILVTKRAKLEKRKREEIGSVQAAERIARRPSS